MHNFIEKYFAAFLVESRVRNPFVEYEQLIKIPPTAGELEELISFLQKNYLNPVIMGTLAVMKHLVVTPSDIQNRTYRPIQTIDILVSKLPEQLLDGWQLDKDSSPRLCWMSPSQGYVKFFNFKDEFPSELDKISEAGKDQESVLMNCPVADVETLFRMKLNSRKEKDMLDLMMLTRKVDIPQDVDKKLWNDVQRKNLEFLRHWAKIRLSQKK